MKKEFHALERFYNSIKVKKDFTEGSEGILISEDGVLISRGEIEVETKKEILKTSGYFVNLIEEEFDNLNGDPSLEVIFQAASFTEVLIFLSQNF